MHDMMGNFQILAQVERLLSSLDQPSYTRPLPLFDHATLGQHFRHILDAYECLLRGSAGTTVDYSSRKRRTALERDPALALQTLRSYRERLLQIDPDERVHVLADTTGRQNAGRKVRSTLGRELLHTRDHTVHHLAIIRMGIAQAFPDIPIDEELGVAPSTLAHRRASP